MPSPLLANELLRLKANIFVINVSDKIISPRLLGTNLHVGYERDIDTHPKKNQFLRFSTDKTLSYNETLFDICRKAGFKLLRFPGGETSNYYHWRDGVGPIFIRKNGQDEYGRKIKNFFGTLEFADVAERLGAEVMVTANYKTGSHQEAANWVEYCNSPVPVRDPSWSESSYSASGIAPKGYFAWLRAQHGRPQPIGVKYWEVGNEIFFYKYPEYIENASRFSRRMKAMDSTIKVGLSSDSFLDMSPRDIQSFYIPEDTFDFLAIHYYSALKTRKPMTNFYHNAESSRIFAVEKSGIYEIAVQAHGSKALEWPRMSLEVNGVRTEDFLVSSKNLQLYTAKVQLKQGINTITLKFVNDSYFPGIGDCNLYVQGVTIAGSGDKLEEIWNTSDIEYSWLFANNGLIENHIEMLRSAFPHLPLMVTEGNAGYGINHSNVDRYETLKLKAGLWTAGLLNSLIRNDVPVFAQWLLNTAYMGFSLVMPDGDVTPTYHVMKMYGQHSGRLRVELSIQSPTFDAPMLETSAFGKATSGNPYVDAVASFDDKSGEMSITALNRHALKPIQTQIALGMFKLDSAEAVLTTLNTRSSEGMEASNEHERDNVATSLRSLDVLKDSDEIFFTLEPHSLTTIKFQVRQ